MREAVLDGFVAYCFDAKKSRHGNHDGIGTPDAARTHDLQSRSLTLYPTELRAHKRNNSFIIAYRIRKSKEKSWRHKAILLLERNTQNRRVPEKLKNPHR